MGNGGESHSEKYLEIFFRIAFYVHMVYNTRYIIIGVRLLKERTRVVIALQHIKDRRKFKERSGELVVRNSIIKLPKRMKRRSWVRVY